MTKQRRKSFRFPPRDNDQLAAAARLAPQSAEFKAYATTLGKVVANSLIWRSLPKDWAPSPRAHRKARAIARKAGALLAELNSLGADDRALLHNVGSALDSEGSEKLADPAWAKQWRRRRLLVFLSAGAQRPAHAPVWLRQFVSELDRLQQIAEAAAVANKPQRQGRQADLTRIIFGRQIAGVFFEYLNRRPTKGRDSPFERTLRVCLAAAGEYQGEPTDPKDLHSLVATILDGMEFDRRVPFIRLFF